MQETKKTFICVVSLKGDPTENFETNRVWVNAERTQMTNDQAERLDCEFELINADSPGEASMNWCEIYRDWINIT